MFTEDVDGGEAMLDPERGRSGEVWGVGRARALP